MSVTNQITIYTDGGSRGNPGDAGISWIAYSDGEALSVGAKFLGTATNNHAEYMALLTALENVLKKAPKYSIDIAQTELLCKLDSELIVKQLNDIYKIKDANLAEIATKIKAIYTNFKSVKIVHIPRSENHITDCLVNIILDAHAN